MKKYIYFCLISLCCLPVLADPWSGNTKITHLYPTSDGLVFMSEFANASISKCDNGKRWMIAKTHVNYDVLVSNLMAAFYSQKLITFNIDNNQSSCQPTINRFLVLR